VGRIRVDPAAGLDASGRSRHWCLWLCGDQLRKGAAQNAIQIADLLAA
jgi:aspartate-semialdehyde dehydrogenase